MSLPTLALAVGIVVVAAVAAALWWGRQYDRDQRADARPPGRHVALPARVAVVPRASTAGDPPWPVQDECPGPPLSDLRVNEVRSDAPPPAECLAERYRKLVPADGQPAHGLVPAWAASHLKHAGPWQQASDAAWQSIFTKDMARQVAALEASDA